MPRSHKQNAMMQFTRVLIATWALASSLGCAPDPEDKFPLPTGTAIVNDGCQLGGCGAQLCGEEPQASDCWYEEWVECYRGGLCERQDDGACGWTATPELVECLDAYDAPDELLLD
jgi:hypothetical protein